MARRHFVFLLFLLAPLTASASTTLGDPTYSEQLVHQALSQRLDQDRYWHILLHYRKRWVSGFKSEIKSRAFYAAEDGRTNPRDELVATIRSFFLPPDKSVPAGQPQQAQCRFIDRYQWLKRKLDFDPRRLPEQPCPYYESWRKALDPSSVTLVFSSYFMNNPSSAFGHTLLRLNHGSANGDQKLLDYGVNYAANPTTNNALFYGLLGLVGGFDGVFSNVPYFMKVEEYNDVESRELWEYDLRFTPVQLNRLMLHLWSVGHVTTPYYFFDQNCSYMILTLLDAANPDLRLADQFASSWWVIPSDTIRAVVSRPGFVEKVSVRPSLVTRVTRERKALSPEEDAAFLSLISHPSSENVLEQVRLRKPESAARILDVTLDYLRYVKVAHKNKLSSDNLALQSRVLASRSEIDEKPPKIAFSPTEIVENRPDAGHDTGRLEAGSGYDAKYGNFVALGIRPAFQDLNADTLGYPAGTQIEMLNLNVRYEPGSGRLRPDDMTLIDIMSVNPWDRIFKRISWSADLGAAPVRDFDCNECMEYRGSVGAGLAFKVAAPLLVYALGKAELGFGAQYTPGYRLGPGAETGALMTFSRDLSLLFDGKYHHPLMGYTPDYFEESAEARYSLTRDLDLRLGYSNYPTTREGAALLNVYF